MNNIIISSTHGCEWQSLLPLLTQLADMDPNILADSQQSTATPVTLSQELSVPDNADHIHYQDALMLDGFSGSEKAFILFYQHPAIGMANTVAKHGSTYQFLSDWMGSARCLSGFFKRNRKNCLVVDVEAARQNLEGFVACLQKLGIETHHLESPATTTSASTGPGQLMHHYLVSTLITQHHADVHEVLSELQACSSMQSASRNFGLTDAISALKQIERQHQRESELMQQVTGYQQQLDHIKTTWELKYNETLTHLEGLTQQLEQEKSNNQQLLTQQSKLPVLQQTIRDFEHKFEKLNQQNNDYDRENQLLTLQVQQLLEELEQTCIDVTLKNNEASQIKEELKQKTKKNEELRAEINLIKSNWHSALQPKEQEIEKLHSEINLLQRDISNLQILSDEPVNENKLLILQVTQLQEELEHYFLENEAKDKQISTLKKKQINASIEATKKNRKINKNHLKALFHSGWYQEKAGKHMRPLSHYLRIGWKKGLSPHPLFDADYYVKTNELESLNINPLLHFLSRGVQLGLSPHPLFDLEWYLNRYPDVAESGMNPLIHFIKFGFAEGRDPSPRFNSQWYLDTYPDVREAGVNPLFHYITSGQAEGRQIMHSY